MKLLDEYKKLRFVLLFIGMLFPVFIDNVISEENLYLAFPYCGASLFLVYMGLFYNFKPQMPTRMRSDLEFREYEVPISGWPENSRRLIENQNLMLNALLAFLQEGVFIYDIAAGKVNWSKRAAQILSTEWQNLGNSFDYFHSLIMENDWLEFRKNISKSLETLRDFSMEVRSSSNSNLFSIFCKPETDSEGCPVRLLGCILAKIETPVHSIFIDALTGLKSKNFFMQRLEEETAYTLRRPDYLYAVILIDINNFSCVNDVYSRDFGDGVLKIIAERIASFCNTTDCTARIDGDVFGIILHDLLSNRENQKITDFARDLYSKITMPLQLFGKDFQINVSMSVVINRDTDKSNTAEGMMSCARILLHELNTGETRGGVKFFTSGLREKAVLLYKMEYDLRKAIQSKSFSLVYQPVVDITKGNRVVAFEALVRWNHSERGYVSPFDFIPIAEESGLIVPLGNLILQEACTQTKKWVDLGYKDLRVAVNFSAKQFAQENLIETLDGILCDTGLSPKNLKIEITEYTAINDSKRIIEIMRQLTNMGFEISIDDFGTGYSSLSYLKYLPVHTLKIDKIFVDSIADKKEDAAFVRMIIGIAKSLHLDLIAEGVENKEQLDFLLAEGCRQIQGYYFSKPLEPAAALDFLRRSNG